MTVNINNYKIRIFLVQPTHKTSWTTKRLKPGKCHLFQSGIKKIYGDVVLKERHMGEQLLQNFIPERSLPTTDKQTLLKLIVVASIQYLFEDI